MMQKFIMLLCVGTCAMLAPIYLLSRQYQIERWKTVPTACLLTIAGTVSTYLWHFVENGNFGGRSFYGAVFLVPLLFIPVEKLMRISYEKLMDLCAPAECVMLVLMKYLCWTGGCCGGKVLCTTAEGIEVIFPSQIAEGVNALLIALVLLLMARNPKHQGKLFPWYMVIYGVSRFALNLFRAEEAVFLLGMTAGNVWSIVSVAVGAAWLYLIARKRDTQTAS